MENLKEMTFLEARTKAIEKGVFKFGMNHKQILEALSGKAPEKGKRTFFGIKKFSKNGTKEKKKA